MLGDTGKSFMIGFGDNYPQFEHHRAASCFDQPSVCDWDNFDMADPNPQVLNGAIVGGPDANDNYNDARDDYVQNEVAIYTNAGVQGVLAYMVDKYY
jgi:endoglucanase